MTANEKLRLAALKVKSDDVTDRIPAGDCAFSAEYSRRVSKLIDKTDNSRVRLLRNAGAKRAAALFLVFALAFSAVFTINAARVSGLFIRLDAHNDYTLVEVDTGRAEHEPPKTILQTFSPAFIPQGYRIDTVNSGKTARSVVYTDGISYIVFTQNTVYRTYTVDEEKDRFVSVCVNGRDAYYYTAQTESSGEYIALFWSDDDYFYSLFLPAGSGIGSALQTAESVQATDMLNIS